MRQQRCRNRDQQGVVAGAPQRLASAARREPAGRRQNQKDLLVRAPGQGACYLLRCRAGVAGDFTRDRYIRLRRADGDRKPWLPTKKTGSSSCCRMHGIQGLEMRGLSNAPRSPRFIVLSQPRAHGGRGHFWLGRRSACALGGAAVNYAFIEHFPDIARGPFPGAPPRAELRQGEDSHRILLYRPTALSVGIGRSWSRPYGWVSGNYGGSATIAGFTGRASSGW